MKVFLDANILVSVLNREYPDYTITSRILSMAQRDDTTMVTSDVCLAIAFYFAAKKHGYTVAKEKIHMLALHMDIAECGKREALSALQNKKVIDFEDGLQYYSALHANCDCIVTNDLDDFYFSDLQVLDPDGFFRRYAK